jgi:hypothetical protein
VPLGGLRRGEPQRSRVRQAPTSCPYISYRRFNLVPSVGTLCVLAWRSSPPPPPGFPFPRPVLYSLIRPLAARPEASQRRKVCYKRCLGSLELGILQRIGARCQAQVCTGFWRTKVTICGITGACTYFSTRHFTISLVQAPELHSRCRCLQRRAAEGE